jgi:peptidoglycan/LPS O-acetylase OafA/YrhL
MTARQENVKWVDVSFPSDPVCLRGLPKLPPPKLSPANHPPQGFRGLASFLVVVTHTVRAFDGHLFDAADGPDKPPLLFQLPFFRVLIQGRIGVAIFSLVTGYVCALKPIRQCRAGKPEEALSSIAKSAFRRIPRLVLPTTIATVIIWALCQLGAFEIAHRTDSWWIDNSSPRRNPTFGTAVQGLLFELICTWTRGSNLYDNNQWSLLPLLRGSFTVYAMLVATTYVQPRYRMMVSLSLVVYYYVCRECRFPPTGTRPSLTPHSYVWIPILLRCIPLRSLSAAWARCLAGNPQMAWPNSLPDPRHHRSLPRLFPRRVP